MTSKLSIRELRLSPMPTRIPVVKGILSFPAFVRVEIRLSGVLSGEFR